MDEERTEDLNPSNEDIEEKVKRMMDPTLPDDPKLTPRQEKASAAKSAKAIKVQTDSVLPIDVSTNTSKPPEENDEYSLPSAPELPPTENKSRARAVSKKINVPVVHQDAEDTESNQTASENKKNIPGKLPLDSPGLPEVKKITITDNNDSPAQIAERLNQAIAGLNPHQATDSQEAPLENDISLESAIDSEDQVANIGESIVEEPADDATIEPPILTSPETDKAVADIVAKEGDELLEVEDALRDTAGPVRSIKKQRRTLGMILKAWWSKPAFRLSLIILIVISLFSLLALPRSRYFVLNMAGIRAGSSLVVLDTSTQQPLKNVEVKMGSSIGTTNDEGRVFLHRVKQGKTTLTIHKRAFAPFTKEIIIGLGSNPLGDFSITPTGSQYSFSVTDFLSGKPASKVEATSGDASAVSDEKGIIKLTVDQSNDKDLAVTLKAGGYRTELLTINPDDKSNHALKLVPARKHVFISKRSGKYDIFSMYVDGKDEKQILAGSGNEKEGMVLVPHPTDELAAYVSTRAGQPNKDGFLLSNLILINTKNNDTTNIVASERVQIIEWAGDRLVYVQIAEGTSANSPKRYRLMAYNYKDKTNKELAASNFFNDVIAVDGAVYYAPSNAYQAGAPGFYRINADGSAIQTIYNQEVWNIFRTAYDHFALSVQQQWYDYRLDDKAPIKLNSAPANQNSRVYIDSPDGKHSIWIDKRDGKGVILVYDTSTKADVTLQSQSGISYPVWWLNDRVIVYRVKTDQEIADYAQSIDGGKAVKVKDVTGSGGIDRWYYY